MLQTYESIQLSKHTGLSSAKLHVPVGQDGIRGITAGREEAYFAAVSGVIRLVSMSTSRMRKKRKNVFFVFPPFFLVLFCCLNV